MIYVADKGARSVAMDAGSPGKGTAPLAKTIPVAGKGATSVAMGEGFADKPEAVVLLKSGT